MTGLFSKMPNYDGWEPSEIDVQRIINHYKEHGAEGLTEKEEDWVCGRLLPSIFRFGCYPPPTEAKGE